MTNLGRLVVALIVIIIVAIVAAVVYFGGSSAPAPGAAPFSFDLSNATYAFMGDTFTLADGSTTVSQGHSGLPGTTSLVPVGYTLAATSSGDLNGDGSQDGVAVLYRSFGANLEWLALFGFSNENGELVQSASSTIYTYDSNVQSVSVGANGIVSVNLLAVSASDQANLPHYEQTPNQPETLQFVVSGNSFVPAPGATSTASAMYDLSEYTDSGNGFTFWYPSALAVSASTSNDSASFPGGTQVERLQIGPAGGTYVAVVNSPSSTITDEPNGHASPIAQIKYFYDASSGQWMVAYPEGSMTGTGGATTTADVSKTTIGGLPMFPSGARFDTTIIPLSTTEFLVVGDGGGSSFTSALAQTVAPAGASVDPSALSAALAAEAAYANQ